MWVSSTFDSSFEFFKKKFISLQNQDRFQSTAFRLRFAILVFMVESESCGHLNIYQLYKVIEFHPVFCVFFFFFYIFLFLSLECCKLLPETVYICWITISPSCKWKKQWCFRNESLSLITDASYTFCDLYEIVTSKFIRENCISSLVLDNNFLRKVLGWIIYNKFRSWLIQDLVWNKCCNLSQFPV